MTQSNFPHEMTPREVKSRLDAGEKLFLLDVRQPEEYQFSRIPGTTLIPLGELPNRLNELNPDDAIVIHCKVGGRSAQAAHYLRTLGFTRVANLTGGINAWAVEIDPTIPTY